MNKIYTPIHIVKKTIPLWWISDTSLLIFSHRSFYLLNLDTYEKSFICKLIPNSFFKKICMVFSLGRRIFRLQPHSFISSDNPSLFFFSFDGGIYQLNIRSKTIKKEIELRHNETRTLSLLSYKNKIYYGEYPTKGINEVGIFERTDYQNWKCAFSFDKGDVRHIHELKDYNSDIYCFTGDENKQIKIIRFANGIVSQDNSEIISQGDQSFRTCFSFFDGNNLFYITDTPYQTNQLIRISLSENTIHRCFDVSGPVIFGSSQNNNCVLFSTAVENNLAKDGLGKNKRIAIDGINGGVLSKKASLIEFNYREGKMKTIFTLKKDFLSTKFGIGTFLMPKNQSNIYYAVSSSCLKKHERCFIFKKEI